MKGLARHDVIIKQLENQISEYGRNLNYAQTMLKRTRGCLISVAEKICNEEFARIQMGQSNEIAKLKETDIRDFIIRNYLQQKQKYTKEIIDIQKQYLEEKRDKDEIAKEYIELQKRCNQLQAKLDSLAFDSNIEPKPAEKMAEPEEVQTSGSEIVFVEGSPFEVDAIMETLDVFQMKVLDFMAETGKNEQPDIVSSVIEKGILNSDTMAREIIKQLEEKKIITRTIISTPIRKRLMLYSISDLGQAIYQRNNGKNPVKDDMKKIVEMHATLEHGYCIVDVCTLLEGMGYTDICMDSHKNHTPLADGRSYVPDIIAMSKDVRTYWEIELGHHTDNDMAEKLEKASRFTKVVHIVVNKAETKVKLQKQVAYFKSQLIRQKTNIDLIVYVGTMVELRDKQYLHDKNRLDLRTKK